MGVIQPGYLGSLDCSGLIITFKRADFISSTNTAYPYLSSPMMLLTSATDSNTLAELCTQADFASQWALELESVARDITQAGSHYDIMIS